MNASSPPADSERYRNRHDQPSGAPRPSELPVYGASLPTAIARYWRKYFIFHGRASRSEYWWAALFNAIVWIALGLGALVTELASPTKGDSSTSAIFGVPLLLYVLATIVPSISMYVRRLHDADLSGWLYWLNLIPAFGGLISLIFSLLPTNANGARFDH